MLKSLFGDLADRSRRGPTPGWGAASRLDAPGRVVAPQQVAVAGSAGDALHEHLAVQRSRRPGARLVTLVDPAARCAAEIVHALAEATGDPVERLQLREHGSLRLLADVERTVVERPGEPALLILHPDVPADAPDPAGVPLELMAASDLAVLIVDGIGPDAAERMLAELDAAVSSPAWRCPALLFLLTAVAPGLAPRIAGFPWPQRLRVEVVSEARGGPSALWNRLLGVWDRVQATAHVAPPASVAPPDLLLDPLLVERQLGHLMNTDGVLGCALVDTQSGALLAGEQRAEGLELGVAAAACAHVMRAQIDAARLAGLPRPVDELMVTAGSQQQVMRNLPRRSGLFLLALLDRGQANLALTRFKMTQAEKNLC